MPKKRYKPEEIVAKQRQVAFWSRRAEPSPTRSAQIGVSEVTYSRWRQEYGGLKPIR